MCGLGIKVKVISGGMPDFTGVRTGGLQRTGRVSRIWRGICGGEKRGYGMEEGEGEGRKKEKKGKGKSTLTLLYERRELTAKDVITTVGGLCRGDTKGS